MFLKYSPEDISSSTQKKAQIHLFIPEAEILNTVKIGRKEKQ